MAESNHDDLADALARMASGDVAPSEHEPPAPVKPVHKNAKPVQPGKPPAIPAKPAVTARRASPRQAAPLVPAVPQTPPPAARSPRPAAPSVASPPVARPSRPQAPPMVQLVRTDPVASSDFSGPISGGNESTSTSAGDPSVIFDDDSVIVPAPDPSAFAHKPKPKASTEARAKIAKKKQLEFRRTLIPVLLTMGVLMFIFASLRFVLGVDSPLTRLPVFLPIILIFGGCTLITFAVINMLSVKAELGNRV
jgi:hypothetical protein